MKSRKKIILSIITALVLLIIFLFFRSCYSFWNEDILTPEEKTVVLKVGDSNKKIYIRSKVWGISSNHNEIVLSENPITIPDTISDYIFYCYEIYYKVESSKSIVIYAPENLIIEPKIPFSEIKIVLIGLKNYDEIRTLRINYEKLGLQRISVKDTVK